MVNLRKVIEEAMNNPYSCLGRPSLDRLRAYISGFLDHNSAADDGCLDGFNEYIAKEYNIQTDHDWSSYIQFFSNSEQAAFDNFIKYFTQYQQTTTNKITNHSIPAHRTKKEPVEDEFRHMLCRVLEFPELYLGGRSLERLYAYIQGFLAQWNTTADKFMAGFDSYIKERYRIATNHNWAEIITFFSGSEGQAFNAFIEHIKSWGDNESVLLSPEDPDN